jgi:AcrR family transcriptional regulator
MTRLSAPDRRATLIDAAATILLEKGFAAATTRDVAARLGIGRGLIHHYFETWEALQQAALLAVAHKAQQEAQALLAPLEPQARLTRLLDLLIVAPNDAHWRLYADAWDDAQHDPQLAAIVADILAWWLAKLDRALAPFISQPPNRANAAQRLAALADGLSLRVIAPAQSMARDAAVALLLEGAQMELAAAGGLRAYKAGGV